MLKNNRFSLAKNPSQLRLKVSKALSTTTAKQHLNQMGQTFARKLPQRSALFFVMLIVFHTLVLGFVAPPVAGAQSISAGSKDGEPAQLNKDYTDPSVKKQDTPEAIKPKNASFDTTPGNGKDKQLAKVEDSVKAQAPKYNLAPKATDQGQIKREKTEKRSALTSVYETIGGGEVIKQGVIPQNYQDGSGQWQKIDYASSEDKDYAARTKTDKSLWQTVVDTVTFNNSQPKSFKSDGGKIKTDFQTLSVGGIQYRTPEGNFSLQPEGAGIVKPEYIKDSNGLPGIKYSNVWDGIDLYYEYRGDSVKEYIVINKKPKNNQIKFKVDGANVVNVGDHIELSGALANKYSIGDQSLSLKGRGPITDKVLHQYASTDGHSIVSELDQNWLNSQKSDVYPMVIDPQVYQSTIPGGYTGEFTTYKSDGFVGTSQNFNVNVGGLYSNGGGSPVWGWRSIIHLPYNQLAPGQKLIGATVQMSMMSDAYNWWHGYKEDHTVYANYANCFGYNCVGNPGADSSIQGNVNTSGAFGITPLMSALMDHAGPYGTGALLMLRGEDWLGYSWKEIDPRTVYLTVQTDTPPPQIKPLLPSTDPASEVVSTTTSPQLSVTPVTDPDSSSPVNYQFWVQSQNGQVLWDSGSAPSPSVVVPEGILENNSSYTWRAKVTDVSNDSQPDILGGKIKVNLRTGKDNSQTYDQLGPVNVNLATGNATTALASHNITALGGNIGLNLTYNSPQASKLGLTAEYFNNTNWSGNPVLRRTDPNINFDWATGSPAAGVVTNDNFSSRWTGYFVAPYDATFSFGSLNDDNLSATLDGTTAVSNVYCSACVAPQYSSTTTIMKAGQIKKIVVNANEGNGAATAGLYVKSDKDPTGKVVPTDWLRTAPQQVKANTGLIGHYYYDDGSHDLSKNTTQFLSRTDSNVDFNWGTNAFIPGGPADNILARWEGYFTAPSTGSYTFGTNTDDGARLYVNGQTVVDKWLSGTVGTNYGTAMNLTAGQSVPIKMEYFEVNGAANAQLLLNGPNGTGAVPTQYLSPASQVTPAGWNISADADGNLAYERIGVRQNGDVAVYDADGAEKVFTNTGTGFKPPVNEAAILIRNDDGSFTLTGSDGRTYVFNADGTLKLTTTPPDDRKPAALQYEYSTINGLPKLKRIIDGVDPNRYGTLLYQDSGSCDGAPSGFDGSTPAGMICGFTTTDGQKTSFFYKNGQLARVTNPGSMNTDLGYDTAGMLTSTRDTSANDAIAAGTRANDANVLTELGYDELGRVKSVTGPKPDATLSRTQHTVEYLVGETKQHITSAPEPNGYVQDVSYDNLLRTTKLCNNRAQCSTTEWDPIKDLVLSSTDASGLKSTTIYDSNDVPIQSYGPAPAGYFGADRKPTGLAVFNVPHTDARYDEGISGPAVSYYDYHAITTSSGNSGVLFGAPKVHTTGVNANSSVFSQTWATPPATITSGMEGWGMSATGLLSFATAGDYTITISSNDGTRMWVDDTKVVDDWKPGAVRDRTYKLTAVAGKTYRLRLDSFYLNATTGPKINVTITPPSGVASNNLSAYLKPGYNLKTSAVSYDNQAGSITAKTAYANPALGLATSSTVDPTGLNLTSTQSYEAPGAGYLRQTGRTEPTGTGYNYAYYGATETADNPCTSSVEAYKQAGQLKGKTNPGGSTSTMIYDDAGRAVAVKTNGDPWTCTTYDARGRATKVVVPSIGWRPGRTTETLYSYGGNPLVTAINDSMGGLTVSETDLTGRTVRSVDSYLNETKTTYNNLGQVTKRISPLGTEDFTYDNFGAIGSQKLDGVEYAKAGYDYQGRINNVNYLQAKNDTGVTTKLTTVKRDGLGRMVGDTYTLPSAVSLSTTDTLSQSNRITAQQLVYDGKTASSSYKYDGAGRLTNATVDNWQFGYGYGAEGTTCSDFIKAYPLYGFQDNASAGRNGNITSLTTTNTVNNQAKTTENCYLKNDRLYKSSDGQIGTPGYDDHGNTTGLEGAGTKIGLTYDATDRNASMTQGDYKELYTRGVDGSIIAKKVYNKDKLTEAYRYYAGGAVVATCSLTNTTQCSTSEKNISLPGNVTLTIRSNQPNPELAKSYAVKNQKGETVLALTSNGKPIGTANLYDPYGGQLFTNTFNTATDLIVSSAPHISLGIAQYGKRLYIASMGRFLQADPVEGGTSNDYAYVSDPVNGNDFNGAWGIGNLFHDVASFVSHAVTTVWNAVVAVARAVVNVVVNVVNTVRYVASTVYNHVIRPAVSWAQTVARQVAAAAAARVAQATAVFNAAVANAQATTNTLMAGMAAAFSAAAALTSKIPSFAESIVIHYANDMLYAMGPIGIIIHDLPMYRACLDGFLDNTKCRSEITDRAISIGTVLVGEGIGLALKTVILRVTASYRYLELARNFLSLAEVGKSLEVFSNNIDDLAIFVKTSGITEATSIRLAVKGEVAKIAADGSEALRLNYIVDDISRGTRPLNQADLNFIQEYNIKVNANGGNQLPGLKPASTYANDGRDASALLPTHDKWGNMISYQEFYMDTLSPASSFRTVRGSNGSVYSTASHYKFFINAGF